MRFFHPCLATEENVNTIRIRTKWKLLPSLQTFTLNIKGYLLLSKVFIQIVVWVSYNFRNMIT